MACPTSQPTRNFNLGNWTRILALLRQRQLGTRIANDAGRDGDGSNACTVDTVQLYVGNAGAVDTGQLCLGSTELARCGFVPEYALIESK